MRASRPRRAVDAAADSIRTSILDGEPPPDGKLPPEPVLAESLGISRLTLRAAIAQLEAEHLVVAEHGKGVRVLDFRRTAGLELLGHLVAQQGLSEAGVELIASFLELRRLLAADAVTLACQRCDEQQLQVLMSLAELQQHEPDPDRFDQRDLEFARELVRAAGSPAMELLLNTVERLRNAHPQLAAAMRAQRAASRVSYGWITETIRAGEQAGTGEAVRELLEPIDESIVAALRSNGGSSGSSAGPPTKTAKTARRERKRS